MALCIPLLVAIGFMDAVVAPVYFLQTKGHPVNEINPEEASSSVEQAPSNKLRKLMMTPL